ncbi:MAG: hypothetical protein ABIH66_10280 [bacterium]
MYFDDAGKQHTDETLRIAKREAEKRGIKHVVVASTKGDTGVKAAKLFAGTDIGVVVVTHNTGFSKPGENELEPEKRAEIEKNGGVIYTGTHVLRGLGGAIRSNCGNFSHEQVVAMTLRIFCQGVKVCVEIAAMAADAGLVPAGDIIAVGGTARGADTCLLVGAAPSNKFFDIKVREVLAKPAKF